MSRVLVIRLLVSVVLLTCFAQEVYDEVTDPPVGRLPLDVKPQGASFVVHAATGVPLPAPLAEGQRIDLKAMSLLDRFALIHAQPIPVGTAATVVVESQGRKLRATVIALPYRLPPEQLAGLERWLGGALLTFSIVAALLTLWRGRDGAAWGLCGFFSVLLIGNDLQETASPSTSLWLHPVVMVVWVFSLPSLYVMAECLAGKGQTGRMWRALARLGVASGALAVLAALFSDYGLTYFQGSVPPGWIDQVERAASFVLAVIPVLTLMAGYKGADSASRRRMRWVMVSTLLLTACFVVLIATQLRITTQPLPFVIFNTLLPGLAVLGYLYAILSARVVEVGFVVDRALVFSATTALMFGLFTVLEDAVHELALGGELGWVVQALGAVAVAAALSPVHRLLDRWLERLFFHKLRTIAGAVRKLARESAFFEDEDALLSRAVRQLLVPCSAAAIYERNTAVYQLRVAEGAGWPQAVDRDDPVFVALRAEHGAQALSGLQSAIGADGLAFPMRVGQLVTGAILVRLREGEQLDRDVRAALTELAHALGASLCLLRYQEQARLLAEIAAGRVDQAAVRTRVEALPGAL